MQVGDSEDELKEVYKFDLTKTNSGYLATSEGLILLFKIDNGIITKIFIFDAQLYKNGHSPATVNLNIIIDELLRIEKIK